MFVVLFPKTETLNGDNQYLPFAPDGIPFTVADTMWRADMQGNHRAVVQVSDIMVIQLLRLYYHGVVRIYVLKPKRL